MMSRRTVRRDIAYRKTCWDKEDMCFLSLTIGVFRLDLDRQTDGLITGWMEKRMISSSCPPLPHFVPWVACWWRDGCFIPPFRLLIEAAITRKMKKQKKKEHLCCVTLPLIDFLFKSRHLFFTTLNRLQCTHTTPARWCWAVSWVKGKTLSRI